MKVLVACEFSGVVRDAFLAKGHDAISCDILPSERPGPHYQGDVRHILNDGWDLAICFPPCTYLCSSGARWWKDRKTEQTAAIQFVYELFRAPIPHLAIENPIGILSTVWCKPDQIIQPWMFGHGELKTTCLWLKGLPPLLATDVVQGNEQRLYNLSPSPVRGRKRSITYSGLAEAMAAQWSFV